MRMPARNALLIVVGVVLAGLLVFVFGGDFIAHKILLVDDQYRGAGSKGSGRLIIWSETLNLIAAHPLFGVGLRQSEQYLHAAASTHNAYLAALAEQGVIGLAVYLSLMVGATVRALRKVLKTYTPQNLVIFGYLVFFLVIGLFEQYSYQSGNSFSLIGMVAAALSWRLEPGAGAITGAHRPMATFYQTRKRGSL
jgi:O-antigen ligase